MNWKTIPAHPLAAMFPRPTEAEHVALVLDMRERGYDKDQPIITAGGQILDGISRRDAAIEAEVEPTFREHKGNDLLGFVIARNLHRRHLTTSQKQMLAADISDQNKSLEGANLHPTREQAAAIVNVSERGVKTAASVKRDAEPEVAEAVRNGTITTHDGASIKDEPPAVQRAAVKDVAKGKTATAAKSAAKKKLCDRCARIGTASCPECLAKAKRKPHRTDNPDADVPDEPVAKVKVVNPEHAGLPKSVANALADTWHAECARLLSKIRKECRGAFSWSSWLDAAVLDHLKAAEECFLTATPTKICPDCKGQKTVDKKACLTCRHGGYLASQA